MGEAVIGNTRLQRRRRFGVRQLAAALLPRAWSRPHCPRHGTSLNGEQAGLRESPSRLPHSKALRAFSYAVVSRRLMRSSHRMKSRRLLGVRPWLLATAVNKPLASRRAVPLAIGHWRCSKAEQSATLTAPRDSAGPKSVKRTMEARSCERRWVLGASHSDWVSRRPPSTGRRDPLSPRNPVVPEASLYGCHSTGSLKTRERTSMFASLSMCLYRDLSPVPGCYVIWRGSNRRMDAF